MPVITGLRRVAGKMRRVYRSWRGPLEDAIPRSLISQYLPPKPIMIEAGAFDGSDAAESARYWPQARIYAFEPVPENFQKTLAATAAFPQIECIPVGLFDRNGTTTMHLSSNDRVSSSVLKPTGHLKFHPEVQFDKDVVVNITTLDHWAQQRGVSVVDFLWLDMQGAELSAMRNGEKLLKNVSTIYTEVSLRPTYEGGPLYPEIRRWLEVRGFAVIKEALPYRDMGNVLFVNEATLKRRTLTAG